MPKGDDFLYIICPFFHVNCPRVQPPRSQVYRKSGSITLNTINIRLFGHHNMTNTFSVWLLAARLRTLPGVFLHPAGLGAGSQPGAFDSTIMGLSLLTAILLQILSSLANDYGMRCPVPTTGADRALARRGLRPHHQAPDVPGRGVDRPGGRGERARPAGLRLREAWQQILTFILLGGAAIVAAITYGGQTPIQLLAVSGISRCSCSSACWGCSAPTCSPTPAVGSAAARHRLRPAGDRRAQHQQRARHRADAASGKITLAVRLGQPRHHLSLGAAGGALLACVAFLLTQPRASGLDLPARHQKPLADAARTPAPGFDGEVLTGALKTAISAFLFSLLLSIGLALS